MAANNVEKAFRLPSGVNEGIFLRQHLQQQQQENINQFTAPPPTSVMSETSSGNAIDD